MSSMNKLSSSEKYISTLVHPLGDSPSPPSEELPRTFIRENKLGVAVAAKLPDFVEETATTATKESVYTELAGLVQQFESESVSYAVIKSLLPVPKRIGDLDILVEDFSTAESLLESRGYAFESRQPYKRKYSRETDLGSVAVHLHGEIAWHGEIYVNKDVVLENTVMRNYPGGEAAVPCPTHEALIIAAHMLFEKANNRILLLDVLSYWSWYQNGELDLDQMQSMATEYGWEFGLRCFFAGVADIYEETYDEPFCTESTFASMETFPVPYNPLYGTFLIGFRQMYAIRKHRIKWVVQNKSARQIVHSLQTYLRDFPVELMNRYGFTYTMKRLRQ